MLSVPRAHKHKRLDDDATGSVWSSVLNVRRHCEDVASGGRLFQVLAAATGNARSPIVESVIGTVSAEVDDERRRCRPGSPATGCRAPTR